MVQKMKEKNEDLKNITVWFDVEMVERLDRLAKRGDIPRHRLIRNLTEIGVDYLEACEKFGFLQTAIVLRDFGNWVKKGCESEGLGYVQKV